jgi:hypothetical protein
MTNQKSGASEPWRFVWHQEDGSTIINANGFLVPYSGSLKHSADIKRLKDSRGNTVSLLATDESVTLEVVAVPEGAAGENSLRDALESTTFPRPNGWVTLDTSPNNTANRLKVPCGSFKSDLIGGTPADVLNSVSWLYNCDGSVEFASDGEWGMRFSITRHLYLPNTAAIVI